MHAGVSEEEIKPKEVRLESTHAILIKGNRPWRRDETKEQEFGLLRSGNLWQGESERDTGKVRIISVGLSMQSQVPGVSLQR